MYDSPSPSFAFYQTILMLSNMSKVFDDMNQDFIDLRQLIFN